MKTVCFARKLKNLALFRPFGLAIEPTIALKPRRLLGISPQASLIVWFLIYRIRAARLTSRPPFDSAHAGSPPFSRVNYIHANRAVVKTFFGRLAARRSNVCDSAICARDLWVFKAAWLRHAPTSALGERTARARLIPSE